MNLDFSPEEIAFRDEVRAFIADNYPADLRGKQDEGDELSKEDYLAWHKILAKKGWIAPAWPVEYGGPGWTPTQRFIWSEETAAADCIRILPFGVTMVGPVIYTFGTPEQKAKFLPGILSGGARAIQNQARALISQVCVPQRLWMVMSMSSTARKRGRQWRNMPIGAFSLCAPTRKSKRRKGSASC
jgi:hypothetical protein